MARILALLLLVVATGQAEQFYRVKAVFTSNPINGDSVTINGITKNFVTSVTTAATDVSIGVTAADTAANWQAHNVSYPYSRIISTQSGAQLDLFGDVGFTVTASMSGAWGTVVSAPQTLTQFTLSLPLSLESATTRGARANQLMDALNYASQAYAASLGAMANFVNVPNSQTITGAKTFSGATILSNAFQQIIGGSISGANVTGAPIIGGTNVTAYGPLSVFGVTPSFYLTDTDGTANAKVIQFLQDGGVFAIRFANDALNSFGTLVSATRSAETPAAISIPNGTVTIANLVATQGTGTYTNAVGYFTFLRAAALSATTSMSVSNATPEILMYDTDGSANQKKVYLDGRDGGFAIKIQTDAGVNTYPFTVANSSGGASAVYLGGPGVAGVQVEGLLIGLGNSLRIGNDNLTGIIGVGTTNSLPPTGMSSGIIKTNATTEPSADPANAVAEWAYNGQPKYRLPSSGVNHFAHNAAAQVQGAGTDYSLTGTYAQVTFGSGGNILSLPTAGTYLVNVIATVDESSTANDNTAVKLYNATSAADISNSERQVSSLAASTRGQIHLSNVITVSSATTLHLYAKNLTAARGSIDSEQTSMSYVRLY